ncbi:VOC family protein [Spirosoma utsteinense]|uniref:Enzyme related to lactoylglutathione lyase n=1 Tax=Spirosoma utsteinense TaxID=2585773 RepID=A0ABR6W7T0_9BACT|nr:VOC family protein [Spirosoma utsteinense]MBC3789039.1 putative enzyme related to lactoylglutathione lyase [Spirosoma utsteinense]MBC3792635.1 putative enzyme related to lactoylglutathione lyase [Spirosoma utsteinense]
MKRVTGIGGIFFKTKDPHAMRDWYSQHLGLTTDQHGATFEWRESQDPAQKGVTTWSPFPEQTSYFSPSSKEFMLNFRVANLEELLVLLRQEGVEVIGEMEVYEYGKFGWILDPEGNKIELWEPVANEPDKLV